MKSGKTYYTRFSVQNNAIKASIHTGIAYIIAIFNHYDAIVKSENFKRRFLEMAAISFGIGYTLRVFTGTNL